MAEIIRLNKVSKDYAGNPALNAVSFCVNKGTIHGLLGPNGAGKSTAMKIIAGLIPATSGVVYINGVDVARNPALARRAIGLLPENPPLYSNMRVENFLKFVAQINGIKGKRIDASAQEVMGRCGLLEVRRRAIGNLSKGYKQRVGIAQALVAGPEVVILDEPMVGLDPNAIAEIRALIYDLKNSCTVLFSTHQLYEANKLCSDITIINKGAIVQSGPIGEIHQTFRQHQVIWAEVLRWDENIRQEFKREFDFADIEVAKVDNKFGLKFIARGELDLRDLLSNALVQKGCGLLFFQEEKMDLEDIFKLAVPVEKKKVVDERNF
ncbi:MAG TPA: ABC transporter ATP-binding protein [Bacteriovoracaceae bacterium]|nr:ABC transporter ATP-binding protein [Bacteriovoracaceae bacterium]